MTDIKSMLLPELEQELRELGQPAFRAKQIYKWLHSGATSFDQMHNLGKALREVLARNYQITAPQITKKQVSAQDGTIKYLWQLADGHCVESVLMHYAHGSSVCVSSQVGCRMGCIFCASTGVGFMRNLTASEILDQVLFTQLDSGTRISNIVLMGIGEPLENMENVLRFLQLVNDPDGLGIGMRHISLSTCGLVEGIDRLAEKQLQLTLSISLHAPDDETRERLMPINRRYNVTALMEACMRYFAVTGRRISFEYAVIAGVNDASWQAKRLSELIRPLRGHVNLIPLNRVEGSPLKPGNAKQFAEQLRALGVNATVRRRLGSDIDAACGQLRRKNTVREREST